MMVGLEMCKITVGFCPDFPPYGIPQLFPKVEEWAPAIAWAVTPDTRVYYVSEILYCQ